MTLRPVKSERLTVSPASSVSLKAGADWPGSSLDVTGALLGGRRGGPAGPLALTLSVLASGRWPSGIVSVRLVPTWNAGRAPVVDRSLGCGRRDSNPHT